MRKIIKIDVVVFFTLILFSSCSKDDIDKKDVFPSDPNALSEVLVIPNASVINSPDLPVSSESTVAPNISHYDSNISYSSGSQIIIPSTVASLTNSNIKGVYVQVKGASTYFNVPVNSGIANGVFSVPVNLPDIVGGGNFTLILKFYDANGNVSGAMEVNIYVTQPSKCATTKVSGGEGLTSNVFMLEDKAGSIKISYDTYTVKDKIDVFQNGTWIGGTGTSTDRFTLRKALNCSIATEALGYVGKKSEFTFVYNPSLGNKIEVVVSGCEAGGTLWEYTFSCPEPITITQGSGEFIFSDTKYSGHCQSVADVGAGGALGNIDVIIATTSGKSFVIYNMPKHSSGTYNFTDGYENASGSVLYALAITGGNAVQTASKSGTVTKTGSNSFTFSCTMYNIETSQTYSATGKGNY